MQTPESPIAGLDEAGRGCLAGPVVAAAVILPGLFDLPGLDDSKKLSPARRQKLAGQIKECALAWNIGVVWPRQIEKINILQSSLHAMAQAASRLSPLPACLLIDGNQPIGAAVLSAHWPVGCLPVQKAIVHGDALVPCIAAASILAKTWRDALMVRLHGRWPVYGFDQHKGYGTRAHYEALAIHGACPMHRSTFRLRQKSA